MKRVHFIRHGQAEGNQDRVFKRPDVPLTELGIVESHQLALKVNTLAPEIIITGPLVRTVSTTQIISDNTGIPFVASEHFSGIRHASSMAGKPKDGPEATQYLETIKEMYSTNPDAHFEDAENYTEFHARMCLALSFLEQRAESNLVVVTHESIIKSLLVLVLHNKSYNPAYNIDLKQHVGLMTNTGVTTFEFDGTWKMLTWNVN